MNKFLAQEQTDQWNRIKNLETKIYQNQMYTKEGSKNSLRNEDCLLAWLINWFVDDVEETGSLCGAI